VQQFEQILAEDHRQKLDHKNCYELADHPIALEPQILMRS
jgi:hypothetical protein